MTSSFRIFDARDGNDRRPRSSLHGNTGEYERENLRERLRYADARLAELADEPTAIATVVELRGERMTIAGGPGMILDVHRFEDVRVGDRVLCARNTMQAISKISDPVPVGSIVSVQRHEADIVEAEMMGVLRAFRWGGAKKFARGERAIVDPSGAFVIGTLGMPPQIYATPPPTHVRWEDVGGHSEAKEALREAIELPYSHPELFAAYGKRHVRGVLLSGPAGCGKTLLAQAAATALAKSHGADASDGFVYVKGPELIQSYIGKSEEAIRRLFSAAREHKKAHGYPAVIFLDECDALLGQRDRGTNISINSTTVPQFLAEMDGLDDHAAMFILATNRPDMLDPAVLREGRVDRKIRIKRPTQIEARQIFEIHMGKRPAPAGRGAMLDAATDELFSDVRIVRDYASSGGPALRLRDFVSGAMIAGIVEQATTGAMMRDIAAGKSEAGGVKKTDLVLAITKTQAALEHANHAEAFAEAMETQARPA